MKYNLDSRFFRGLDSLTDLLIINLLWIITSLPIVTIGASTAAAYAVMDKCDRHQAGGIAANYFRCGVRDWKAASLFWIVQLALSAALLYNFLSLYNRENPAAVLLGWASLIVLLVMSSMFSLIYPMVARYKNSVGEYLHNAAILFRANPIGGLAQIIIPVVPVLQAIFLEESFMHLLPFWLLIGVAIVLKLCHKIQKKILLPLEPKVEEENDTE